MSKDEDADGFLSRWSKRKTEQRQQQKQKPAAEATPQAEVEEEIDLATLPSIDSLTADSDFSLFLRKGVPLALRNEALRKLWLVEPSVVNYKALVEYNWDFTAPGYGELLPTDDVAKMAQQVFSGFSQESKPEEVPPSTAAETDPQQVLPAPQDEAIAAVPTGETTADAELPIESEPAAPPPPRRRHGGALPS